MAEPKLRADAQRNLERLTAAAVTVFGERGLDAPLEEIAKRAGVSAGTLYNRFGGRDALIDAVMPDLMAAQIKTAQDRAEACADPWQAFVSYVESLCELQASNAALNDAVSRRFPDAERLTELCDNQWAYAARVIDGAHADGSLRADFTAADMPLVLWSTSNIARATAGVAPDAWRRALGLILDGLRAGAAHPLPVPALTEAQNREAMLRRTR